MLPAGLHIILIHSLTSAAEARDDEYAETNVLISEYNGTSCIRTLS